MRIRQALFSLQSIIFRVALQHGWHGPWRKAWNGTFVPDSHKCHPTYPYRLVPAWHPHAPAHGPCSSCITHADADGIAGSSCSLKKHVEMFLEVIRILIHLQQQSATFQLSWEVLPFAIYFPPSLQFQSVCLSGFPLYTEDVAFS